MMHKKRRRSVSTVATAEELASMLTTRTWTLCSGFTIEGHPNLLFLNDSISEGGAAEFALVRISIDASSWMQIESITFSWCTAEQALEHIRRALRGEYDESDLAMAVDLAGHLDPPGTPHRCHLCA